MSASVCYLENALNPQDRTELSIDAGVTIHSQAPKWDIPFICFLNGEPALRETWSRQLQDGDVLSFIDVRYLPQGGGGDSDPLRTVLMIAAIYYTAGLGGAALGIEGAAAVGSFGVGIANMAVTMAGLALVNALVPPPKPVSSTQNANAASPSPTYSLGAQGNSARLGNAIPEHFGRMLAYPDFAAQPYVEYINNDQYLYQLFCIGRGEYDIESIRIEDTSIYNFPDVTPPQIVPPGSSVTLFPSSVITSTEVSGQDLVDTNYVGPFVINSPGTTANMVAFDFVMPRGLYYAKDDGSLGPATVVVSAEIRKIDDFGNPVPGATWVNIIEGNVYGPWSDWTEYSRVSGSFGLAIAPANTATEEYRGETVMLTVTHRGDSTIEPVTIYYQRTRSVTAGQGVFTFATNTPQRRSFRFEVAPGRYEARVRRQDTKDTRSRVASDIAWTGLRAYMVNNYTYGDMTLMAVKMKATNSLSSTSSRKINVIATRKLPIWNGAGFVGPSPTRSIAQAFIYACRSVGLTTSQIDMQSLLTLEQTWNARGDYFDGRFDNFITFWEAATKIAQAGRAKPFMQGGVMRIMRDQASTIPVGMFSMRNIVKGSFTIDYVMPTPDTSDSVRLTYFDNTIWKPQTLNAALPTSKSLKPAKVDMFGVTGRQHAFRESMYLAAVNRYRRRIIKFSTEMEGFIPSFGDLISIQHDMPGWGQGGDVVAYDSVTRTLTLSEAPQFKAGETHYIALRRRDGSQHGPYVVTAGSAANKVVLAVAPDYVPYTGYEEERTHYSFGWADTYRQLARVVSVKPASLTRVTIECVNEDPNVHTADTNVFAPVAITSQLSSYTNYPTVQSLYASKSPFARHLISISWQPTPWANSYLVEQSIDARTWVRVAETSGSDLTATAIGSDTITYVRVAAIGLGQGPWKMTSYTMPPLEDVSGLTVSVDAVGTLIKWNQCLDTDYAETEIRIGDSWDTGTLVARKSGLTHYMNFQKTGTIKLWARHFDVFKKQSGNAALATLLVTGPEALALSYSTTGNAEVLNWTIPASLNPIDRYEIRYGTTWATATVVDNTKASGYRRQVTFGGPRTYWVAAIDAAENYGTPAKIDISIAVPGAVTAIRAEVVDNNVLIYWAPPATGTLPVDRYEVRKGDLWASAQQIGSNGNSTFTTVFEQAKNTYTYWVAAIDSANNYGTPVSIAAFVNQPPDYVLRTNIDSKFDGVKVNTVLDGLGLIAPVNTAETWTQHFVNNGFASPAAQVAAGYPLYIEPGLASGSYTEVVDYGTPITTATTIVATLNSTPLAGTVNINCQISYSNTSATGPWIDGASGSSSILALNFRWVKVVYTFTGAPGANLIRISGLNIKLSTKQRSDSGSATITNAATGVFVPFGYPFISADTPVVQPSGTAALIPVVDYTNAPNPTGFTVYLYSLATGLKVTGSFSWSAKGF